MVSDADIEFAYESLTPRGRLDYCPHVPTPRQQAALYLLDRNREVFFGGAAGGGKTDLQCMAALSYVHLPGASLILRRTTKQLSKAGGPILRLHEWLGPTDAVWSEKHSTWTFPSGHVLELGHCEHEKDKFNYLSAEYQFVGVDELTTFTRSIYTYIGFSRVRRLAGAPIPLRTCGSSNPGGIGHDWVDERFHCDPQKWQAEDGKPLPLKTGRAYVRSTLEDNPFLDRKEYTASLDEMTPVERAQLLAGDWSTREPGGILEEAWFPAVDRSEVPAGRELRYWDRAATKPHPGNPDPDWTRGCRGRVDADGVFWITDFRGMRDGPGKVEALIEQTARQDGYEVAVRWEEEPGSSGKGESHHMRRLLEGLSHDLKPDRVTGPKLVRATPLANHAEAGNVRLVRADWNRAFWDEAAAFGTEIGHDDFVDAAAGCYSQLTRRAWGFDDLYGPEEIERAKSSEASQSYGGIGRRQW